MIIRIDVLQVLQKLLSNVSLSTPHRIDHITEALKLYVSGLTNDNLEVSVDIDLPNGEVYFLPNHDHVMHCSSRMVWFKTTKNIYTEPPILVHLLKLAVRRKSELTLVRQKSDFTQKMVF